MIIAKLQSLTYPHLQYTLVTVITSDLLQRRYTEHTIPYFIQVCVICIVGCVTVCVFSTHAMTGQDC